MALTLFRSLKAAKNRLHADEALLWLVQLDRDGVNYTRVADWAVDVVYNGNTYTRGPMQVEDLSEEDGSLTELSIAIPNVIGAVQGRLEVGEYLNRQATLHYLPESRIGQVDGALSATYYIIDAVATPLAVAFRLGAWPLSRGMMPQKRFLLTRWA